MSKHDPAFPCISQDGLNILPGVSKREMFIAMALQGILANPNGGPTMRAKCEYAIKTADLTLETMERLDHE